MTAYQKRKKERDEAIKELHETRRVIHDFITTGQRTVELVAISLQVSTQDQIERAIWQ